MRVDLISTAFQVWEGSFEEFLSWWDVGLNVESLLRLASAAAVAPSGDGQAAKQANARRKAKRKQSLVEGLAVGGGPSSEEQKDRPGRRSERDVRQSGVMPAASALPDGAGAMPLDC